MSSHYPTPQGQWGQPGQQPGQQGRPQQPSPPQPFTQQPGEQGRPQQPHWPQQPPPQRPAQEWRRHADQFPRPTPPGVLTAARILVFVPSVVWLFSIAMIWMTANTATDSLLAATMQTFALSLAAGDWVPMVLLPISGCLLTLTMKLGHQVDRWLFSALGGVWLLWFWSQVHFPLTPSWFTAVLVILATASIWSPSMNRWVAAVQMWEMDRAGLTPESNGQ